MVAICGRWDTEREVKRSLLANATLMHWLVLLLRLTNLGPCAIAHSAHACGTGLERAMRAVKLLTG